MIILRTHVPREKSAAKFAAVAASRWDTYPGGRRHRWSCSAVHAKRQSVHAWRCATRPLECSSSDSSVEFFRMQLGRSLGVSGLRKKRVHIHVLTASACASVLAVRALGDEPRTAEQLPLAPASLVSPEMRPSTHLLSHSTCLRLTLVHARQHDPMCGLPSSRDVRRPPLAVA